MRNDALRGPLTIAANVSGLNSAKYQLRASRSTSSRRSSNNLRLSVALSNGVGINLPIQESARSTESTGPRGPRRPGFTGPQRPKGPLGPESPDSDRPWTRGLVDLWTAADLWT